MVLICTFQDMQAYPWGQEALHERKLNCLVLYDRRKLSAHDLYETRFHIRKLSELFRLFDLKDEIDFDTLFWGEMGN